MEAGLTVRAGYTVYNWDEDDISIQKNAYSTHVCIQYMSQVTVEISIFYSNQSHFL